MSIGTATACRTGKVDPSNLYIKLKNGAVYRYKTNLTPNSQKVLVSSIKKNNYRVQLKHWTKVA